MNDTERKRLILDAFFDVSLENGFKKLREYYKPEDVFSKEEITNSFLEILKGSQYILPFLNMAFDFACQYLDDGEKEYIEDARKDMISNLRYLYEERKELLREEKEMAEQEIALQHKSLRRNGISSVLFPLGTT
jgi:hypothetical protein